MTASPKNRSGLGYRRYNAERNIILISAFPKRGHRMAEDSKGVCSYTQCLAANLGALLDSEGQRLIVLAEKRGDHGDQQPNEDQATVPVLRVWKRNSIRCFLQILWTLVSQLSPPGAVLIQFEFNLFGGITTTAFFPLFVLMLKIFRKNPCLMIHQVPGDLAEIRTHAGLREKPVQFVIYRALLPVFYKCLLRSTPRVAVHEPLQKERLEKLCQRPISVIPHGCPRFDSHHSHPSRSKAREALHFESTEIVLLCFGFLTHYKGSDWIVREIAAHVHAVPDTPLRLIMAGGESPNHEGKPHYTEFVNQIFHAAAKCPGKIQITGFVPDDRVPLYFAAADIAVFPYRTHMSASGPLSLALSFGRPVLLSNALRDSLTSEDFRVALREVDLEITDLTFEMSPGQLIEKALALASDRLRLEAMSRMALAIAAERNWEIIARRYLDFMHGHRTALPRAEPDEAAVVGT